MNDAFQRVLVVDRDGIVVDAGPELRSHVGRRCRDVVGVQPGTGASPCRAGCVQALLTHGAAHATVGRTAAAGAARVVCAPLSSGVLVTLHEAPPQVPGASLTPREREVLVLVARGLTTTQIARRLGVTYATARTHVERIRDKTGARSRTEALERARKLGWYP